MMHVASYVNSSHLAQFAIDHGGSKHSRNRIGQTPYHVSCIKGNWQFLQKLMEMKDNEQSPLETCGFDIFGYTPLSLAAMNGHHQCIHVLMNNNSMNGLNDEDSSGWTPLTNSSYRGHYNVCERLIHCGADINLANGNGITPMLAAIDGGNTLTRWWLMVLEMELHCSVPSGWETCQSYLLSSTVELIYPQWMMVVMHLPMQLHWGTRRY